MVGYEESTWPFGEDRREASILSWMLDLVVVPGFIEEMEARLAAAK